MPRLSASQQQFVTGVASRTGLSPRVVAAWVVAEEGYRKTPVGHDDHNWLNIGNTDTQWHGGGNSWADPNRAARLTAKWIKGEYSVPGFGRAAPGIRRIVRTAGQSPTVQIQAIANSGWASSGYEGGSTLRNLYHQIQGVGDRPPATSVASGGTRSSRMATPSRTITTTDDSGRRQAIAQALLGSKSVDPLKLAVASVSTPAVVTKTTIPGMPGQQPVQAQQAGGDKVSEYARRAKVIDRKHLPYQWGGGHAGKVTPRKATPLDCSGAVSAVLGINPRVSGDLARWGKPGRGKRVTIYANGEHTFMEIDGHFFGTSGSNPGGGAGWIPRSQISSSYLRGFTARHPPGM